MATGVAGRFLPGHCGASRLGLGNVVAGKPLATKKPLHLFLGCGFFRRYVGLRGNGLHRLVGVFPHAQCRAPINDRAVFFRLLSNDLPRRLYQRHPRHGF